MPDMVRVVEQFVDRRVEALVRGPAAGLVPIGSAAVAESDDLRAVEVTTRARLRETHDVEPHAVSHRASVTVVEVDAESDAVVVLADEYGEIQLPDGHETSWRTTREFTFARTAAGWLLTGHRPTGCGILASSEIVWFECPQ